MTQNIVPLRSPSEQHEPAPSDGAEMHAARPIHVLSFVKNAPGRAGAGRHFWMPDKLGQGFLEASNRGEDMALECVEYAVEAGMSPVINWVLLHMPPYDDGDEEERGLQAGFIAGLGQLAMIAVRVMDMAAYRAELAERRASLAELLAGIRAEEERRNASRRKKRAAKAGEAAHG